MKNWICYHNAFERKCEYGSRGLSEFYFGSSANPNIGDRVWVIEAIGDPGFKKFRLSDCFVIDEIADGLKDPLHDLKKNNRTRKVAGKVNLMAGKEPVYFDQVDDEHLMKPLYQYIRTAPGFSGVGKRISALEKLFSLA
ncbi:hypothetical protein [Acinetobacter ursingii]|uniref:hypothetical protein n=1 Tax=Acinetobacter ursingii TaxID=108980 RepID=UPI00124DFFE4|nr:hypothetical protein [Acinetobacter ursingii]